MRRPTKKHLPAELRITDPYVLRKIEQVRVARGEKTSTQTASRLLLQILPLVDAQGDLQTDARIRGGSA